MSYPYPPPPPYGQQPYGPPGGYPGQSEGNPGLAVTTAILGIIAGGLLAYQTIDVLADVPSGAELPGEVTTMIILHFLAAAIAMVGAVLVFARQIAGAFLLLAGGITIIAVVLLDPVIVEEVAASLIDFGGPPPDISATSPTGAYYELLFQFGNAQATLRVLAMGLSLVVAILAALPPSLNWLRKPASSPYGTGYPPPPPPVW